MEFYPQPPPPPPHWSCISLNDSNFPCFYETANDRNNFLGYFLTCMKDLHLYNYNLVIHHNVINMIQKLKEERYVYMSETNRLKEKINQLEYQNGVFKTQLSTESTKSKDLNTLNQKLTNDVSNLEKSFTTSEKKCQELEQKLNSTNARNQEIFKQNKIYQEENIRLNYNFQKLEEERIVFFSENKRLIDVVHTLEYQNGVFKTQLSNENTKANNLNTLNQKLMNDISIIQRGFSICNERCQELEQKLTSTNVQNQELSNESVKVKNLNTLNQKLQVDVSNLQRCSAISTKKCQVMEQKLNSTNVQNQELSKQTKFLKEENIDLNFKIKELKGKMKSIKECEEIISTKNEEIEKLNGNIQNLIKEKSNIIIDEIVEEQKTILGFKKKLKGYEMQLNYEKENVQKLMNEKAMIIIEFSKKVDQEHRMVKDLEEKLREYEIRKNCIISEADNRVLENVNEQTNVERSRKRPRLSSISNRVDLSSNLSQDIKQFCGSRQTSFYQSDHSPQNPLSETSDTTIQPFTNITNRHENIG